MSTRFNTLLHGSASDAADLLGGDIPNGVDMYAHIRELRTALVNAMRRIDKLEKQWEEADADTH